MLAESHPLIRRVLRFIALPYCYIRLVNWKECTKTRYQVAKDLLFIFFKFKYYPDNYSPCRFWEKDRSTWAFYYGSTYNSYPRIKLRKDVQPFEYQILFNDKSVSEQLCKSMGVQLPHSFGIIDPSVDCHSIIENIFENSYVNKLIIKPVLGHAGRGIILAIKNSTGVVIRTKEAECSLSDYVFKEKAIIQEVIIQDSEISKISNNSLNTIRVVSLLTKSNEVMILSSSMRFGSGNAFVDNWSAGGVAVGVDHKNGKLMEVAFDKHGNQYHKHPDTMVSFYNFQIPYWADVIEISQIVQKSCPFYKLIGVDVAISTKGPVLIEINANPDIVFQEQTAGPLLKDNRILAEFHKHDLLINKYQKNLLENN